MKVSHGGTANPNRVNTSYTPVRTEADRASGDPPMSGLQDSPRLDPAGSVEPP